MQLLFGELRMNALLTTNHSYWQETTSQCRKQYITQHTKLSCQREVARGVQIEAKAKGI